MMLSAASVGRLLAQLGITCRKPLHRAREGDEALVQQWLKKEYPGIKKMAQKQGADIYFSDAARIRSGHHGGRTWGKKVATPMVEAAGARHSISLISAISSRGRMRFMIQQQGGVNAAVFIEFLKRLIASDQARDLFDRRSWTRTDREENKNFCRNPEGKAAAVLSAALFAGPHSRRAGAEASENGHHRPHGCDQQGRLQA